MAHFYAEKKAVFLKYVGNIHCRADKMECLDRISMSVQNVSEIVNLTK